MITTASEMKSKQDSNQGMAILLQRILPQINGIISLCKKNLLLFLQLLDHRERNVERVRHDVRWSEGEPLRQADIGDPVALVEFDPDQLFGFGRIFNVMA